MKKLYFLVLLCCQIAIAKAQTAPPPPPVSSVLMTGTIGVAYHKDYGSIILPIDAFLSWRLALVIVLENSLWAAFGLSCAKKYPSVSYY